MLPRLTQFLLRIGSLFWLCTLWHSAIAASFSLTSEEQDWLISHPDIRLCIDPDYAPVEFLENDNHQGMTKAYYDLVSKRLGITFQTTPTASWNECLDKLNNNETDVIATIKKTEKRSEWIAFTEPYITNDVAIIMRSDGDDYSPPVFVTDLYEKKVAVVSGYFYEELLQTEHPKIEVVPVKNTAEGLIAIAFGQADAFFSSYPVVTNYIVEKGITNLEVAGVSPYKADYRAGMRKEWAVFSRILNKVFNTITEEEKQEIDAQWIKLKPMPPFITKEKLFLLAFIIGLVGTLSYIWIILLRRQVKIKTGDLQRMNHELESMIAVRTHELKQSNTKLQRLTETDTMTQLSNRYHLDNELINILNASENDGKSVAVYMIDIDFFKKYNDQYGHLQGDHALSAVAETLKASVDKVCDGQQNFIARYGGEEFTIITFGMTNLAAESFAQVLIHDIESYKILHGGSEISDYLTISIGLAWFDNLNGINSVNELISPADEALYDAKEAGRNRYHAYE